jgi:hypothetical protein
VWDVRGTQPDRARPGSAVNYERVFQDTAPLVSATVAQDGHVLFSAYRGYVFRVDRFRCRSDMEPSCGSL